MQDEVIDLMLEKATDTGVTREMIFAMRWLDVEEAYRSLGWKVNYEKPGYGDSGKAHFIFSIKKA